MADKRQCNSFIKATLHLNLVKSDGQGGHSREVFYCQPQSPRPVVTNKNLDFPFYIQTNPLP